MTSATAPATGADVLVGTAAWMTRAAFFPGGPLDVATKTARAAHGERALALWRASVTQFARGRPITSALLDEHDRQSLQHYALYRAAAHASIEYRYKQSAPKDAPSRVVSTIPRRSASAIRGGRR